MPGAPYREDDDSRGAPVRAGRPRPTAVGFEGGPTGRAQQQPQPHPPALEGLTATGAAAIGLVGTTLGAILDAAVSPGLGWIFFAAFLLMSAFVGLRLRGRDSWASIAVPPLVYIGAAGIAAQVAAETEGGWVARTSGDMAIVVLDHPFILMIGTALAVAGFAYRALLD